MISLNGILGNVDAENIDRSSLVRVMQIRDFRYFSDDLVDRLTCRAEQEFGRSSTNKPVFELPAWEKKIHIYFQTHRSSQPSALERNLTLMAKVRYFQWMNQYESADRKGKAALMSEAVADMRYWQGLYFDYLRYLEQPVPTLAELHRDFQKMINDFKVGALPEEVKRIDSFAQNLSQALFAAEVQKLQRSLWDFLR